MLAPEFYFAEEEHQQYLAKNPTVIGGSEGHRRPPPCRHLPAMVSVAAE